MSAPGTLLVTICAALAVLPPSPCAFFASHCRPHERQVQVDAEPAPARSCCARHDKPAHHESQPQRETCQGNCCRTSPFVPVGGKLLPASRPAASFAVLPIFDDSATGGMALSAIAVPRPPALNILHCQWRC